MSSSNMQKKAKRDTVYMVFQKNENGLGAPMGVTYDPGDCVEEEVVIDNQEEVVNNRIPDNNKIPDNNRIPDNNSTNGQTLEERLKIQPELCSLLDIQIEYKCRRCFKRSSTLAEATKHAQTQHQQTNLYTCGVCSHSQAELSGILDHLSTNHGKGRPVRYCYEREDIVAEERERTTPKRPRYVRVIRGSLIKSIKKELTNNSVDDSLQSEAEEEEETLTNPSDREESRETSSSSSSHQSSCDALKGKGKGMNYTIDESGQLVPIGKTGKSPQ